MSAHRRGSKAVGKDSSHLSSQITTSLLRISGSSTFVTLLVGPEERQITCHKALLGYYSEYLNGMPYGNCIEAHQGEIKLPEDNNEDISAFVKWATTGNIYACHQTIGDPYLVKYDIKSPALNSPDIQRLWVLGNKFIASKFTNDVMRLLMKKDSKHYLSPPAADSKLFNREEWLDLLERGGSLSRECAATGFNNRLSQEEDGDDD
ncbi:hypothetical protein DL98DRAFT_526113 [Cadophora sp. DSE1049]|nr:hypothetical protein DL98DRAFT_526113 [Cadophora sp. DSE1049]